MNTIELKGCTAEPFGSYLKALAILRIISEQKDPNIRGFWNDGTFQVETNLDENGIINFFLESYCPTPIVTPWNRGGGFFGGNKDTIDEILKTTDTRLEEYRTTINKIKHWNEMSIDKDEVDEKKILILMACRNKLPESALKWMDAAIALTVSEKRAEKPYQCPPILRSGGNEGHLEYSITFMNNIMQLLNPKEVDFSKKMLKNALFGYITDELPKNKTGQFDPGRAGGYNQGSGKYGIAQKNFPSNPWNFTFSIEGTIVWTSGVGKRYSTKKQLVLSPFSVTSISTGFSSSSPFESSNEKEIWAPLWIKPTGIKEICAFIGEGRSDIGRKPARNTIEFAEAVSSFGVDRGVHEFVRFTLLKRRGDSYIALPAGHFPVHFRKETDLIRELGPIIQRLDFFIRKFKNVPASISIARKGIDDAIYETLLHGGPIRMKKIVSAIGRLEQIIAIRDPKKDPKLKSPLSGLSPQWLIAVDDGSVEVRLAAALASIGKTGKVGPIRANLEPVDPSKPFSWVTSGTQMAWIGGNLSSKMASTLAKRMMEANRTNSISNPVYSILSVRPEDISAFIENRVDESLVQDLLFGFMWIKWSDAQKTQVVAEELRRRWNEPTNDCLIPRSWAILKLMFMPIGIKGNDGKVTELRPEPAIIPLLRAGRTGDACEIAKRRLTTAGFQPTSAKFQDVGNGERIAAALLIPSMNSRKIMDMVMTSDDKKDIA